MLTKRRSQKYRLRHDRKEVSRTYLRADTAERDEHVMTREGLLIGPDEGKVLRNPIGGRMVVKVRDGDTGGSYSVHDNVIPAGMEHFFEEAAEGRIPLQAVPTDPETLKRREVFTGKYGYEFAEFPQ